MLQLGTSTLRMLRYCFSHNSLMDSFISFSFVLSSLSHLFPPSGNDSVMVHIVLFKEGLNMAYVAFVSCLKNKYDFGKSA